MLEGAAVGSVVPGDGTATGAVVGFVIGAGLMIGAGALRSSGAIHLQGYTVDAAGAPVPDDGAAAGASDDRDSTIQQDLYATGNAQGIPNDINPSTGDSYGGDFIDRSGHHWDVKQASDGAASILDRAQAGESLIVDCTGLTPEAKASLVQQVQAGLPSGAGRVIFVGGLAVPLCEVSGDYRLGASAGSYIRPALSVPGLTMPTCRCQWPPRPFPRLLLRRCNTARCEFRARTPEQCRPARRRPD
jgi:hypothetical protein